MKIDTLETIIHEAINPEHFAVRPPLRLTWEKVNEEVYWELYRGRALDAAMTRNRVKFRAWNINALTNERPESLISVKWDLQGSVIHVTRAVLCYAHEAVTSGNVVETRATTRWIRELVGSIKLDCLTEPDFREELQILVAMAVYGTGRLPLTSLEAPLPQFLLGQLAYLPSKSRHNIRVLEFDLRDTNFGISPSPLVGEGWGGGNAASTAGCSTPHPNPPTQGGREQNPIRLLRQLFRSVSLSPYTCLVSNVIRFLRDLRQSKLITPIEQIDFLSWLIRLQWRHLNAYDLFLFHHRGANYPDALLVDDVLHELLLLADQESVCFSGPQAKLRRRGLRLAWFLKLIYAGHVVPVQPTSPGENLRVLPAPFERVPDEQIYHPNARPRQLFDSHVELTSNSRKVLVQSLEGLADPDELAELGTALILDRPLGIGKLFGEPDATPMLSHVGRSRKLALRILKMLREKADERLRPHLSPKLDDWLAMWQPPGPLLKPLQRTARPGVVSIDDVLQTADDFHIEKTTPGSVREFVKCTDWKLVDDSQLQRWHIILPVATPNGEVLQVIDCTGTNWLTLQADLSAGYKSRRGVETPVAGIRSRIRENSDPNSHEFGY